MITILDTSGASVHLRPEAILGVSLPSLLEPGADKCQIMLAGGTTFLTVRRRVAEAVLEQLNAIDSEKTENT